MPKLFPCAAWFLLTAISTSVHATQGPPIIEHFTARVTDLNKITLDWQVTNGSAYNFVYIYDTVGYRLQSCPATKPVGCSTSFRVKRGGVHRYTLLAHNKTARTTATVRVNVPRLNAPRPPRTWVTVNMFDIGARKLAWKHSGNGYVRIEQKEKRSVLPRRFPATGNYTVPAEALKTGQNTYKLSYCEQSARHRTALCSPSVPVTFDVGPARFKGNFREFVKVGKPVTVSWSDVGNVWHLRVPSLGIDKWLRQPRYTFPKGTLTKGIHGLELVSCVADGSGTQCSNNKENVAHHEIVAGLPSSVPSWSERSWKRDFTGKTYDTSVLPLLGASLAITFDSAGRMWSLGEFSAAVAEAANGKLTAHDVSLKRVYSYKKSRYKRVRPFGTMLFGSAGYTFKTPLGEAMIPVGNSVWFIQGGSLFYKGTDNHARVVGFDPTATDDPSTVQDDRFCAIHVPGDNNALMGLAWDARRHRLWFTEKGAIAWFKPDEFTGSCNNLLNYDDPKAVEAASAANRCSHPGQRRCIHVIAIPAVKNDDRAFRPNVVVVGPRGFVWFSDLFGYGVARYNPDAGKFYFFPVPNGYHTRESSFGGATSWLAIGKNAVYIEEYSDVDIVRLDTDSPDLEHCTALVHHKNPCMRQLYLPMRRPNVTMHHIVLQGNRLWFTLPNEAAATGDPVSLFGYVDVDSWAAGKPSGVLYFMSGLGTPRPGQYHAPRGIEVSRDGGVALADFRQTELIHLIPRP